MYDALLDDLKAFRGSPLWAHLRTCAARAAHVRTEALVLRDYRDASALTDLAREQGGLRALREVFGLGDYVSLVDEEIRLLQAASRRDVEQTRLPGEKRREEN